jgi:hypothetical protein
MEAEIVRLRRMLTRHITSGVGESVDQGMTSGVLSMASGDLPGNYKVAVGTGYISASGRVVRYSRAAEAYRNSTWAKIHGRAMDYLIRANPEGLTLSEKVWNVTWEGEKAIRRAVNLGVLQGKAPAKISREIRGFLAEPDRLYRRVRRGGRLVLSRPAAAYHPGRGVYRSSAKNAMRLARTEYQRAFHEGMVRYMAEKTWIDGGIWRIGNVDACEICRELQDRFFPKDEIPEIPHPQCLPADILVNPVGDIRGTAARRFSGNLITVEVSAHQKLTCTPNHPVLTRQGWIPASEIKEGQDVVCAPTRDGRVPAMNDIQPPSLIQDIVSAFNETPGVTSIPMPISAPDFHGDGMDGQIAIVSTNRHENVNDGEMDATDPIRSILANGGSFERVTQLSSSPYDGPVFNLETSRSYYIAGGIATHNCMCHVEPHIAGRPLPDGVKTGKPDPSIVGDLLIKSVK